MVMQIGYCESLHVNQVKLTTICWCFKVQGNMTWFIMTKWSQNIPSFCFRASTTRVRGFTRRQLQWPMLEVRRPNRPMDQCGQVSLLLWLEWDDHFEPPKSQNFAVQPNIFGAGLPHFATEITSPLCFVWDEGIMPQPGDSPALSFTS